MIRLSFELLPVGRVYRAAQIIIAGLTLYAVPALAQSDTHAHGASGSGAPTKLGTVAFSTSANAPARAAFNRGIALLHSFHYEEAASAFKAAERADTTFALPFWFEAFTYSHLLWGEDDPKSAQAVLARLAPTPAARLARASSPRERDYGAAFEAFFGATTIESRTRAFADSMRSLTSHYPDDLEAAAFAALAIMLAIDQSAYPSSDVQARSDQMIELAQRVFAASPNHPGAAHYLIHVSDIDASFTTRSLPAARAYARIAPDASHALHMPSHVFLRLGLWDEVASSNERSWAASRREMARDRLSGADLDAHSLEFLAYAYLETGRWRAARALIDTARRIIGNADVDAAQHVDGRYALSTLSFLIAKETGQWRDVIAPPAVRPPANRREQGFAVTAMFARTVTAAMRGDTSTLAATTVRMRGRADSLQSIAPMADYVAAELEGVLARARGDNARAIERFEHAAQFEDRLPQVGPPSFLMAREQVGQLYLALGRADSAAVHFERSLVTAPNRSASLLGLARARRALGDSTAAVAAYQRLRSIWRRADADVPALAEARAGAAGSTRHATR